MARCWLTRPLSRRLKEAYDPREFEKVLAERAKEAAASREALLKEVEEGKLDPSAPDFNQGALNLAPGAAGEAAAAAAEPEQANGGAEDAAMTEAEPAGGDSKGEPKPGAKPLEACVRQT
jgi:hypothetical protein